jgi:hypothetical protein
MSSVTIVSKLSLTCALVAASCATGDDVDENEYSDQHEIDGDPAAVEVGFTEGAVTTTETADDAAIDFDANDETQELIARSEQELAHQGERADPVIIATFALYGNVNDTNNNGKDDPGDRLNVDIPAPLKTSPYFRCINTLGFDCQPRGFSVRKYAKNKDNHSHWWNAPNRYHWAYDDVGDQHPFEKDEFHLDKAIETGAEGAYGIIYIAFQNGTFRDPHDIKESEKIKAPALYFFEVFDEPNAYIYWLNNYGHVKKYPPLFNITKLSKKRGKSPDCDSKVFDTAPEWDVVAHHMWNSAVYRYERKHISRLYMGFYSGCYIDHDDAKLLVNHLVAIDLELKRCQHTGKCVGTASPDSGSDALRPDRSHRPGNERRQPGPALSNNHAVPPGNERRQPGPALSNNHAVPPGNERRQPGPALSNNHVVPPGNERRQPGPALSKNGAVAPADAHRQPAPAISKNRTAAPANEHRQPNPAPPSGHPAHVGHGR